MLDGTGARTAKCGAGESTKAVSFDTFTFSKLLVEGGRPPSARGARSREPFQWPGCHQDDLRSEVQRLLPRCLPAQTLGSQQK